MSNYTYDPSGNVITVGGATPQIVMPPVNQIGTPGGFVTFSVVIADARGATFQWKFNGANIPGATADSLVLNNLTAANEGQYSVAVTNSAGTVTSAPAALLLDSDGDGLPDSWVKTYFHPSSPQPSDGDPDGDGISNLDEFLDGTNPTDPASMRPRLVAYSDAGGSVAVAPMKLSYARGDLVKLTATPFAPSVFAGWTGDLNGTSNPATLTLDGNKTVRARFASVAPLPPGLLAFWRGEPPATGSVVPDMIGGHTGGFFQGTTPAAPVYTANGKVGSAFSFDGTLYIQIPDAVELHPLEMTAEAWIFLSGDNGRQAVIARGSSTNDNDAWYMGVDGTTPFFDSNHSGLDDSLEVLANPLLITQWTHIAISFDGTTKRIYVNGQEVASRSGLGALTYDAASVPVTIGNDWVSNAPSTADLFLGLVDEVSLYDRALTAAEIMSIYNADVLGKNVTSPYFTSASPLPSGTVGSMYSQQLATILGTAPVSFSLSAGALPLGITLSSTGALNGTPSVAGTFDFTVRATDAAAMSTEQLFVLSIA